MLEFIVTSDGSKTLYHPKIGEHYHSRHGALQESKHVFLGMGLNHFLASSEAATVSVLEIGFGTGLNFLVSAHHCLQQEIGLHYVGVEAFPLSETILAQTGYDAYVSDELWETFLSHYPHCQRAAQSILTGCSLHIAPCAVCAYHTDNTFDVIYFDAFAAVHQPEMWTAETLSHVCKYLKIGGIFVTYAITGHLKRTLQALGFTIEKVTGAPGKREMLRALKNP